MEFQAILDAARALPVDDRARLVDLIQEELETQDDGRSLSDEQIWEIRRRVAAHDADPCRSIPWEQFEAHIDKRVEELGE